MGKVELRKATEKQSAVSTKHMTYQLNMELPSVDAKMMDGYPTIVKCNPFKVSDIKTLVYSPDDESYYETLAKTVDNLCDVDVLDLCVLDFEVLVHFLRVNVCGTQSSYMITCSNCEVQSPLVVDLAQMQIRKIVFEEGEKLGDLTLILPRVKARMEMEQYKEYVDIDRWALYIQSGETFKDKVEILNNSSPDVLQKITAFNAKLNEDAGIDALVEFKCPKCGTEDKLPIPFRGKFFLPEYSTGDIE